MTEEANKEHDEAESEAVQVAKAPAALTEASAEDRGLYRLETRLARAEAQIHALQDSLSEIQGGHRAAKHRALMIRLVLLVILLGGLFYMQASRSGAG
jgi:hypothetical protein